jgi:hypothetical protein
MRTVAAPFINRSNLIEEYWLTKHVPGDRHKFDIIPRSQPLQNWHDRKSKVTGLKDWLIYWQHGTDTVQASRGGAITVFPQLPAVLGMQRRLTRKRFPIIAWLFNVGTCSSGMRRQFAKASNVVE